MGHLQDYVKSDYSILWDKSISWSQMLELKTNMSKMIISIIKVLKENPQKMDQFSNYYKIVTYKSRSKLRSTH